MTVDNEALLDRGDDFAPSEEDLEKEAERVAAEAAENERVAKGDKKDDEKDDEKVDDKKVDDKKVDDKVEDPKVEDPKVDEKRPEPRLPLSRHREILSKERERADAAERRAALAEAEKAGTAAQIDADIAKDETKVDELEGRYSKALADGDVAVAQTTMREIRQLERSINDRRTEARIATATAATAESIRYDNVVSQVETAYPQLMPGHDKYDVDKVREVLLLKAGFEANKFTPSAALQKAVGYVFPVTTKAQADALDPEIEDVKVDETPKKSKEVLEAERKAAAVAKGIDTSKKQPSDLKDVGIDSDKAGGSPKTSVLKMSQDEFDKLGEDVLARLRGDDLS